MHVMLPHRIRLRGPWQIDSLRTIHLPDDWEALGDEPARLVRNFGWPNPLAAHERVWLVLDGLTAACVASLNDALLGTFRPPVERDITALLRERNVLQIELPGGARWDEASLEVRGKAWLSELSAERRGDVLVVRGRVNGTADGRLDLYAILDRRTVIQSAFDETERPFALMSEPVAPELWRPEVHIELVHGPTVWHAADVVIAES
jgi:hypothetical protein